jgi:hypothetical protein
MVGIMRDLGRRGQNAAAPKGIAFEISDLVLAQSWAAFNEARMVVRLDHGSEDEEYEEVIDLRAGPGLGTRLILWRNATTVFVQPVPGRKQNFDSVAEAFDSLLPKHRAVLSDISAAAWPID